MANVLGLGASVATVSSVLVQRADTTSTPVLIGLILGANFGVLLVFSCTRSLVKAMQGSGKRTARYVVSGGGLIVGLLLVVTALIWAGTEPSTPVPPGSGLDETAQPTNGRGVGNTDTGDIAVRGLSVGENENGSALSATIVNRRDRPVVLKRLYWTLDAGTEASFECPEGSVCSPPGDRYIFDPTLFSVGDGQQASGELSIEGGGFDGFTVSSEVVLSRGYSEVFEISFDANLTLEANEVRNLVLVLPLEVAFISPGMSAISRRALPDHAEHLSVRERRNIKEWLRTTDTQTRPLIRLCLEGAPRYSVSAASTGANDWASASIRLEPSSQLVC